MEHFRNFYAFLVLYFSFVTWAEFSKILHCVAVILPQRDRLILWQHHRHWHTSEFYQRFKCLAEAEAFKSLDLFKKYLFITEWIVNLLLWSWEDKNQIKGISIDDSCNFQWMFKSSSKCQNVPLLNILLWPNLEN